MSYVHSRWIAKLAGLPVAILLAFAAPSANAFEQGEFHAGLYTAPGQLFTVKSPLGPESYLVDGFDRSAGAVTFLDDSGKLFGVICTQSYDVLAGADNDFETDEDLLAALKQENMTLADLRRNLERTMIVQRVQQNEVLGRNATTEEEARAYYESHLKEFTTQSTIMLREILVSSPADPRGLNVAVDEAARKRADAIRVRLVGGDNFEQLVTDVSDSPTKATGGLIGPLNVDDLSADIRKIIDPLKTGDLTEVLHTARGYQILKLESRTDNQTVPFEQAHDQINNRLVADKRRQEFEKYLVKLRAQAIIDWKNQDVKKAYLEGLKQPAPGDPTPSN